MTAPAADAVACLPLLHICCCLSQLLRLPPAGLTPGPALGLTHACVSAEKEQQKGILIGIGGSAVKMLGTAARAEIEAFLGRPVCLSLKVKVSGCWGRPTACPACGWQEGMPGRMCAFGQRCWCFVDDVSWRLLCAGAEGVASGSAAAGTPRLLTCSAGVALGCLLALLPQYSFTLLPLCT